MVFARFPSSVFQFWVFITGTERFRGSRRPLLGLPGRAVCSPTPPPSGFTPAAQGCAPRPGSFGSASLVIFRLQVMRTFPLPPPRGTCAIFHRQPLGSPRDLLLLSRLATKKSSAVYLPGEACVEYAGGACLCWERESVEGETGKKRGIAEEKSAPTYLGKGEGTKCPFPSVEDSCLSADPSVAPCVTTNFSATKK